VAYGVYTIRVDGNDLFAIYNATKEAKRICVELGKAVLIEAMTYRIGHHSTSDDWTRYRPQDEVSGWQKDNNPINRLRGYIEAKGIWNQDKNEAFKKEIRAEIMRSLKNAEREKKPHLDNMFLDVYDKMTPELEEQMNEMRSHIKKYPTQYPTGDYSDQL